MKRIFFTLSFLAFAFHFIAKAQGNYTPTKENLQSRQEFSDMKFGIFLHWGIYSMFGQGEWYLQNANIDHKEYANLLLNIGPQPSGELPAAAISRLHEMGEWLSRYGESIYGTTAGEIQDVAWGTSTRKGNTLYLHVTDPSTTTITLPSSIKFKSATCLNTSSKIKTRKTPQGICISIPHIEKCADVIISVK